MANRHGQAQAAMPSTALLTADDLASLPDIGPHELVRGVLRIVSLADASHGSIVARLLAVLTMHVDAHDLGEVFSEGTGFLLERNPDTVLGPDLAFVARQRLPAEGLGPSYLDLGPDLAVEVVSKNDRRAAVMEKVADYLRLGVRSVWVVRPTERTVAIYEAWAPPGRASADPSASPSADASAIPSAIPSADASAIPRADASAIPRADASAIRHRPRLVSTVDEHGFLDAGPSGTMGAIGDLLPGFRCAVASLFSALRRQTA